MVKGCIHYVGCVSASEMTFIVGEDSTEPYIRPLDSHNGPRLWSAHFEYAVYVSKLVVID